MNLFINIETTGLDRDYDRIIELAILKVDQEKKNKELFHRYFNPEMHLTEDIIEIIKVDYNFLKKIPLFNEEVNSMLDFIGNSVLVSHNIEFVTSFINSELKRCGKENLNNQMIDTLDYARKLNPEDENTLEFLFKKYDFEKLNNNSIFKELMVLPDLFRLLKNKSTN